MIITIACLERMNSPPFRNIMNEWYARDISKKIRSTFKAKGKAGKHVASVAPYGYLKDPNDGNHWVVDEEAAEVVRQIFRWTMEGFGPYQEGNIMKEVSNNKYIDQVVEDIVSLVEQSKRKIVSSLNDVIKETYWGFCRKAMEYLT